MNVKQLTLEIEVCNQRVYQNAEKAYNNDILNKDFHPVFLVFNKKEKHWFTTRLFSKEFIESYKNFQIVK